jgi:AraC-like DNA-binding protein
VKFQKYTPLFPLSLYIDFMICYEENQPGYAYLKAIPEGFTQMVIELKNEERFLLATDEYNSKRVLKNGWIENYKTPIVYETSKNASCICIRFRPNGFYTLTKVPADEIQTNVVDGESVLGVSFIRFREQLLACNSANEMFLFAEMYFRTYLPQSDRESSIINFVTNHQHLPIAVVAEKSGYSQKHLISIFKKHTGYTPKYFSRIRRFNNALQYIKSSKVVDWSTITYHHNYFDQAHFIKEFQHFVCSKPGEYLKAPKINSNTMLANF